MSDHSRPPSGQPGDFGDLSPFTLRRSEYHGATDTAVRCFPVELRGRLIGYLWAAESDAEDAADFFPLRGTGGAGFDAAGVWRGRLKRAKDRGLPPLAAVRRWVGEPEDPAGGRVRADDGERALPDSAAVRRLAHRGAGPEGARE